MALLCARILLLLMMCLISEVVKSEKTDIVYLQNGDRVTGEVKSLLQ